MANKRDTAAESGEEPSFEQALERLETIVQELEGGALTLDESLARFEEGTRLSQRLTRVLDQAEKRIERLSAEDESGARADAESSAGETRPPQGESAATTSPRRAGHHPPGSPGSEGELPF